MEEVRFRLWDHTLNVMIYDDFYISAKGNIVIIDKDNNLKEVKKEEKKLYTIMQYTGLKDMSGKPMYECDIIKYLAVGCIDSIVYKAPEFTTYKHNLPNHKVMVIGNIFENPEFPEYISEK